MIIKETMGECSSKYLAHILERYEKSYVVMTSNFRKTLGDNISKVYCKGYNQAVRSAVIKAFGG